MKVAHKVKWVHTHDSRYYTETEIDILLANYVPYTGATANVNLGTFNLTTTGTVQAEQLTSTDDITMFGHSFTMGDDTKTTDSNMYFKSSGNDGRIRYDQSMNRFVFSGIVWCERPGLPLYVTNTWDEQIAIFYGYDGGWLSLFSENDNEAGIEYARIEWANPGTEAGSEEGRIIFYVMDGGELEEIMHIDQDGINVVQEAVFDDLSAVYLSAGDIDVTEDLTAGTIEADNGFTGNWVNAEGKTVTVVGGIITGVV